jgi:transcriptional regulator with XRE-family HTH domain
MTTYQDMVLEMEGRGWSLTALAKVSGASVSAISDLKHGRTVEPRARVGIELLHLYSTGAEPPSGQETQNGK